MNNIQKSLSHYLMSHQKTNNTYRLKAALTRAAFNLSFFAPLTLELTTVL